MLATINNRWVLTCDSCPVRLDVAPAVCPESSLRAPSGWLFLGAGKVSCPLCSRKQLSYFTARIPAVA